MMFSRCQSRLLFVVGSIFVGSLLTSLVPYLRITESERVQTGVDSYQQCSSPAGAGRWPSGVPSPWSLEEAKYPRNWNNGPCDTGEDMSTGLQHIVFGLGSRVRDWPGRRHIIRSWWRPELRGFVWMDAVPVLPNEPGLEPPQMLSSDTSTFPYQNKGDRSTLRLARIAVESFRLDLPNVRWFVMCDDDTFISVPGLVAVLSGLDHRVPMLVGGRSETHMSNVWHGHDMAFGGGGYAVSRALAEGLNGTIDSCLMWYPDLLASDERVTACALELGVRRTEARGFHQCDLQGNLQGLLEAHPPQPFVSLHHLMNFPPLFPFHKDRAASLRHLEAGIAPDPVGFLQQAVCYSRNPFEKWTMSIAWGYSVRILPRVIRMREMIRMEATFSSWLGSWDPSAFDVDIWWFPGYALEEERCGLPIRFFVTGVEVMPDGHHVISTYKRYHPKGKGNFSSCDTPILRATFIHVIRPSNPDPLQLGGNQWYSLSRGHSMLQETCQTLNFSEAEGASGERITNATVVLRSRWEVTTSFRYSYVH